MPEVSSNEMNGWRQSYTHIIGQNGIKRLIDILVHFLFDKRIEHSGLWTEKIILLRYNDDWKRRNERFGYQTGG